MPTPTDDGRQGRNRQEDSMTPAHAFHAAACVAQQLGIRISLEPDGSVRYEVTP